MRTTITLDSDVAARVKSEMQRTGKTFKEVLNSLVRRGCQASAEQKDSAFHVHARDLGERPGLNYDNIGELLEQAEGPEHK